MKFQSTLLTAFGLISSAFAVTPLVVRGADFVNSVDNSRFQIIGVAYQPGGAAGFDPANGIDPLSEADVCLRDAVLLQRLGANAIRVYNLNPDLDHTECASIFNAAGIYMILDVNSPLPNQSLNRGEPWTSYSDVYMERVFQVVERFMNFPNTLGFFSGNEVINEQSVPEVPAYIRAVTRDIKDYIAARGVREIPVGYSAADVRPLLAGTYNYLACGLSNDTSSKIDFFGLNSYAWCGEQATYETSEYNVLVEEFANTSIPIFFSEYGCNQVQPRTFPEVDTLYSLPMMGVFSGGVIYEYSEEPNNYGLVDINDDGSVDLRIDYENLLNRQAGLDLAAITRSNGTATSQTAPVCAVNLISSSNFTQSFEIPARADGIADLIRNGVSGNYPTGVNKVSSTRPSQTVKDRNGNTISGLELNVLADDESNLPGGNTSGTSESGTTTGSGSSPTQSGAAEKVMVVNARNIIAGSLAIGLMMQL